MKTRFPLTVFAVLALSSVRAAIYLNAAAPGETDGLSWSTAYKTLPEAMSALASCEDRTLYVAKGVYYVGANAPYAISDKAVIVGGFLGETDGDLTRDADENQTIFSGIVLTGNNSLEKAVWRHIVPTLGGFAVTSTALTDRIVVDGKLNLPAPTGDYDTYYPSIDTVKTGFVVGEGAELSVSGVRFVCFRQSTSDGGAAVRSLDNAKKVVLDDCVFAAGAALRNAYVSIGPTVEASVVTNCGFYYNGNYYNSGPHLYVRASANVTVDGCRFVGAYMSAETGSGTGVAMSSGVLRNSVITHNLAARGATSNKSAVLSLFDVTMENCVVSNNFVATKKAATYCGSPLLEAKGATVRNTLFANNRAEFNALDGSAYSMIGYHYAYERGNYGGTFEDCLFVGNTVAAPTVECLSGTYAIGLVGCVWSSGNVTIVGEDNLANCQFENNAATCLAVDGVSPVLCRGVLSSQSGGCMKTFVTNCTFVSSSATAGAADVALYSKGAPYANARCEVVNSLFLCEGDGICEDAVFANANGSKMTVRNCTIQNLFDVTAQGGVPVSDGLYCDKVPFVRVPYLFDGEATGYGWLQPTAKTPGLLATTDGSVRGAVNALTDDAANGKTLTIRRSPFTGGTVSPSAQAVADGTATAPVTATPTAGGSLIGWAYEDGLMSDYKGNPLVIDSLEDDLVLVAVFGTRQTTITFDLGEAGVFTESGSSRCALELSAGQPFPQVPDDLPAFTINDSRHIYAWDPGPSDGLVPNEDLTICAHSVTKDVRTVTVKPGDDLVAAAADAGRYRGIVEMAAGTYTISAPIPLKDNVTVRGSADGGTVLSGDNGGTAAFAAFELTGTAVTNAVLENLTFDTFARTTVNALGDGESELEVRNCRFYNCASDNADTTSGTRPYVTLGVKGALRLSDSVFTNCKMCVSLSCAATTNVISACRFDRNRISGVSVTSTGAAKVSVTGCVFTANHCRDRKTLVNYYMSARADSDVRITDCTFADTVGDDFINGAVYGYGNSAGSFLVARCSFVNGTCVHANYNNSANCTVGVALLGSFTTAVIRDSAFVGNAVGYDYPTLSSGGAYSALYVNGKVSVVNCTFADNMATAADNATYAAATVSLGDSCGLANCVFRDNTIEFVGSDNAADVLYQRSADSRTRPGVVNTVLFSGAADYVPVWPLKKLTLGFTAIQGFDPATVDTETVVRIGEVWTQDPKFRAAVEDTPGFAPALGLKPDSPYLRAGTPLWEANDGSGFYVTNALTGNFRCVADGGEITAVAAAAKGVGDWRVQVPDAWGAARRHQAIALGPLNAPKFGLTVLIR